jgi:benzoyl-CoA reductase/2-hydroxyglutaryl-CoA dehydratase subunit BcrC/BadD/HgdB
MSDFHELCKYVDGKFADSIKSGNSASLGVNTSEGLKEQFDYGIRKWGVAQIHYMDYKVNNEDPSKYTLQILGEKFDSDGSICGKHITYNNLKRIIEQIPEDKRDQKVIIEHADKSNTDKFYVRCGIINEDTSETSIVIEKGE